MTKGYLTYEAVIPNRRYTQFGLGRLTMGASKPRFAFEVDRQGLRVWRSQLWRLPSDA